MTPPPALRDTALSRRTLLGLLGAGTLAALAGCASPGVGASGRDGIRFFLQKAEVIGYFDELMARFGTEAGIRVVHDTTPTIAPGFVRGAPADVGCFNHNLELARYVERGVLSDLSDRPAADRIVPSVLELGEQYATFPGRLSVLPYSLTAAGVIYNVRLFEEQGLEVPRTWDEFLSVCDAFATAGITPVYETVREPWTVWQGIFDYTVGGMVDVPDFYERMRAQGTEVGPDSEVSFQTTFAEPMERALQIHAFANDDAASRGYPDGNLAFGRGEAAMYLQGPWAMGEIAKIDPDLPIGTFALPMTDDPADTKARVNIDLGLWIPESTPSPEAARELVDFLMSPEIIDAYNEDNLAFGVTTDAPAASDPRLAGLQPYIDDAAYYQGAGTFVPPSIPLGNYVQSALVTGNMSGMLRQLDDDWRRIAIRTGGERVGA